MGIRPRQAEGASQDSGLAAHLDAGDCARNKIWADSHFSAGKWARTAVCPRPAPELHRRTDSAGLVPGNVHWSTGLRRQMSGLALEKFHGCTSSPSGPGSNYRRPAGVLLVDPPGSALLPCEAGGAEIHSSWTSKVGGPPQAESQWACVANSRSGVSCTSTVAGLAARRKGRFCAHSRCGVKGRSRPGQAIGRS